MVSVSRVISITKLKHGSSDTRTPCPINFPRLWIMKLKCGSKVVHYESTIDPKIIKTKDKTSGTDCIFAFSMIDLQIEWHVETRTFAFVPVIIRIQDYGKIRSNYWFRKYHLRSVISIIVDLERGWENVYLLRGNKERIYFMQTIKRRRIQWIRYRKLMSDFLHLRGMRKINKTTNESKKNLHCYR